MDDEEMWAYVHRAIETASRVREQIRALHEHDVSISIHVSTDVYTWLSDRAERASGGYRPERWAALYGFPLVHEDGWENRTRIEVHTRRVIV